MNADTVQKLNKKDLKESNFLNNDEYTLHKKIIIALEKGGSIISKNLLELSKLDLDFDYNKCLRFALNIGTQINILKYLNYGIPVITINNILVSNDGTYILDTNKYIDRLDSNNNILLTTPFLKNKDNPPELKNINKIPNNTIYYTAAYYSLAKLCLLLLNTDLKSLYPTKLYFLLERCLRIDPRNRVFLYV
tara:strand:+ start:76 stop:651 length:576 start_codon:yes stop_codon:yes gene_type:complete